MKKIFISLLIIFLIFTTIIIGKVQAAGTVDDVMNGASSFIKEGESNTIKVRNATNGNWENITYGTIDNSTLKTTANFLYNLLLSVGIIVAVVVGVVIGIKLITGSIEEKAEYKELLFPYLVSCVVVFGAFGIWKIVIKVLVKF